MTVAITIHWWLIPLFLLIVGGVSLYISDTKGGFNGITEGLAGIACIFAALVSLATHYLS